MNAFRIVKVRDHNGIHHSLRLIKADVEHELMRAEKIESVQSFKKKVECLPDASIVAFCALNEIILLGLRIREANCEQGNAPYATKAHMASWAALIVDEALGAIEYLGVDRPEVNVEDAA